MKNSKEIKQKSFSLFLSGGIFLVSFFLLSSHVTEASKYEDVSAPSIYAKAAFVYDFRTQSVLYEKNSESQLPLASLTKIMTALVAEETLSDDLLVEINKKSLETEGEYGLREKERWRLFDLLAFTLIESSNDAAAAIAFAFGNTNEEKIGEETKRPLALVEKMNEKSRSLRLSQTFFLNPTGLDQNDFLAGAYGSARDMAHLTWHAYIHSPKLFSLTAEKETPLTSFDDIPHTAKNTNDSLAYIPGTIVSKTGFTDLAGGNLALIFEVEPMHPIGIVVLGSTREARFTDAVTLSNYVLQSLPF